MQIKKILLITTSFSMNLNGFAADNERTNPFIVPDHLMNRAFHTTAPSLKTSTDYPPITQNDLTADRINPHQTENFLVNLRYIGETIQDQNRIGHLTLKLLTPNMNGRDINHIMKTIEKIPLENQNEEFIHQVKQLMWPNITVSDVINIIGKLGSFPLKTRSEELIHQVKQFMQSNMAEQHIFGILQGLLSMEPIDRTQLFIDQIKQLIQYHMNDGDIYKIIKSVHCTPIEKRPFFINSTLSLLGARNVTGEDIRNLFNHLHGIPVAEQTDVLCHQIQQLMKLGIEENGAIPLCMQFYTEKVIKTLQQIPQNDRDVFIEQLTNLPFTYNNRSDFYQVMSALADVDENNRESFIQDMQSLQEENPDIDNFAKVVEILSRHKDYSLLVSQVKELKQAGLLADQFNSLTSHFNTLLESLSNVRASSRTENFINHVKQLIQPNTTISEVKVIISILSKVNVEDYAELITQIKQLTPANATKEYREGMIKALPNIGLNKLTKDFIDHVKQFMKPDMGYWDICGVMDALLKLEASDRPLFINQAKQLISPDATGHTVATILFALAPVSKNERACYVARALLFQRGDPAANIRQLLETPLINQIHIGDMRNAAQGANPYAGGVNVHSGSRDHETIKAVRTLYASQVSENDLENAYNDFLTAVSKIEESRQSLILRSLGIDVNGTILPKPGEEFFSGLISGIEGTGSFTLSKDNKRLIINGKELLSRLWHFANTYIDQTNNTESERDNIRASIMDALAQGVNEKNSLRCEAGRVQLLLIATAQGRLHNSEGQVVDIDGLGLNAKKNISLRDSKTEELQHANPQRMNNLNEIAHYLQPFINTLTANISTAEQFYNKLYMYREALAEGNVLPGNQHVDLNPSEMVYFLRMMTPVLHQGGVAGYEINPEQSIITGLGFNDAFTIEDYLRYFGGRDQAQFEMARKIEADRALRAQQDLEYAETERKDQLKQKEKETQKAAMTEKKAEPQPATNTLDVRAHRLKYFEEKKEN